MIQRTADMIPLRSDGQIISFYDPTRGKTFPRFMVSDGAPPSWDEVLNRIAEREANKAHVIYFIGADDSAIKIGTSSSAKRRLKALQMGSPVPLKILATRPGSYLTEQAYHSRFAEHRLHGEWFAPHPDIIAEIESINAAA